MWTAKQRIKKLDALAKLAKEVGHNVRDIPAYRLTRAQELALFNTLRTLDIHNEYSVGYELRRVFGIERDNKRRDTGPCN